MELRKLPTVSSPHLLCPRKSLTSTLVKQLYFKTSTISSIHWQLKSYRVDAPLPTSHLHHLPTIQLLIKNTPGHCPDHCYLPGIQFMEGPACHHTLSTLANVLDCHHDRHHLPRNQLLKGPLMNLAPSSQANALVVPCL